MARKPLRTLYQYLQTCGGQARRLYQKAAELATINYFLTQHLESPLREHCQAAKIEKGKLVIIADGAVWTTQLNYIIPDLLFQLRTHPELIHLGKITCKVGLAMQPAEKLPSRDPLRISSASAEHLKQAAALITNEKLRAVMERIAAKHIDAIDS